MSGARLDILSADRAGRSPITRWETPEHREVPVNDSDATVVVAVVITAWVLVIVFAAVRSRRQLHERDHA